MGTMRVTQNLMIDRVLSNLSKQSRRILNLQDQLATGQRVNRPSDDPLATRRAIDARAEIAKYEQFLVNISTTSPILLETETAISTIVNVVQRAYELTLQGASDTNGQPQRDQIALEINQLLESLLVESNHITNGRYVFGGTRTLNPPFVAQYDANGEISAVTYEGNEKTFAIEILEGVTVPVSQIGSRLFTPTDPGTANIFQTLIDTRDNLRAGDTPALQTRLEELGQSEDQLLMATARIGAVQNRIERVDANIRDYVIQLETVLSDNIDADFAEVAINLNAQSNAFQAALNAAARVIQPSLLDFIA